MSTHTSLSIPRASLLVAEREMKAQLRTKSFLISSGILMLLVLGGIILTSILGGSDDEAGLGGSEGEADERDRVAVVTETEAALTGLTEFEAVTVADQAAAEDAVRSEDVIAAVLPGGEGAPLVVLGLTEAPGHLVDSLTQAPATVLLEEPDTSFGMRYALAMAFGLIFMMAAMTFGGTIAQNTVVEKQTRTVEILLSAVPARALLGGKVLGISVLAFGQTAAIAAVAIVGLSVTGQGELLNLLTAPLLWFVVFFIFGFLLLASIYAASASLVSRIEDTGSVLTPVSILAMAPYFISVFMFDSEQAILVTSYIPFTAPVTMPLRLFMGEAMWWEPLLSLGILVATTLVVTMIGAKIYEGSLLKTSARISIKEALAK